MTTYFTALARPYAIAVFEYALAQHALPAWEELLQTAAIVAEDPLMIRLMTHPHVGKQALADLFCDVLRSELDSDKKNFIQLLAIHRRFAILPEIARQFKQLRAAADQHITVNVISAVAFSQEQEEKLIRKLAMRFRSKVTLHCTLDPRLIGGMILRAGDHVIDGSVRGKLNRLFEFI